MELATGVQGPEHRATMRHAKHDRTPTASTETMVARGHASVAARSRRLTATVPVLLELRRKVFGEHTTNKSPESVTDDECANPAVGLA